eukprot:scaffold25797_cov67-Isochrysis_galbana.AAC.1
MQQRRRGDGEVAMPEGGDDLVVAVQGRPRRFEVEEDLGHRAARAKGVGLELGEARGGAYTGGG